MRRRAVLRALAGSAGAAGLAGCLGAGPGGSTPTPTPTDSGPHPVTPAETTFAVRSRRCGQGTDAADVRFADDRVTVEGTIAGRDGCDTAALEAARLRAGDLTVVVAVVEEPTTGTRACVQCLTDVDYAFEATVPGDRLERVSVVHATADGRSTVTTVEAP